jgi:hypothetical protein
VDALAAHEGKVDDLKAMAHIDDKFRDIAKSMLDEAERAAQYDEQLLAQTLKSFRQTERGVGESEQRLRSRLRTIELLKIDLEAEAKKHLYDAILSAGFEICVQIVSSTAAVGGAGAVATGGAAAPAAILTVGGKLVEAGEILLDSGAKISFTAQEVQKSGDFASLGEKIDGAAKALHQLGKMVFEIYKIIKTVADTDERASQISASLRQGDFGEAGVAELTGAYYWDLMKISAQTALKMPLAMELPSADRLRDEIDSLAVKVRLSPHSERRCWSSDKS